MISSVRMVLASLLFVSACVLLSLSEEIPSVNNCTMCMECLVTEVPPNEPATHADMHAMNFQPLDVHQKQTKPMCSKCKGCTHSLKVLVSHGKKKLFGTYFNDEAGASPQWLFVTPTNKTRTG